jgi:hypothetical protein
MAADQHLLDALATLWRIPRPGPDNLLSAPAFVALSELCDRRYGRGKATFALSSALSSLGLPCGLPLDQSGLALDVPTAAAALDAAYTRAMTVRRHICPLDLADDLPPMTFGGARVGRFTAEELEKLFGAPRLARNFPALPLESKRLAQFHWLVVEEEVEVDPRPEARATPFMFVDTSGGCRKPKARLAVTFTRVAAELAERLSWRAPNPLLITRSGRRARGRHDARHAGHQRMECGKRHGRDRRRHFVPLAPREALTFPSRNEGCQEPAL